MSKGYPFSPAVLDALPEELAELFRSLEMTLLDEICTRLNLKEQFNEVTVSDIKALRSHGIELDEIKKAISKTTGIGEKKLDELLDDVVTRNQQYYDELITLADVTKPDALVEAATIKAIKDQCQREFGNIARSMGFLVDNGRTMLKPAKAYQWALDNAEMQIQSGAASYNEAIRNAVKQLADSGIKTVSYESGHRDQIDVAVRRAVMTGINQLCSKYTEQAAEWLNTPYFEVSAHAGARDKPGLSPWSSHKAWQGKVYSANAGDIYPSIYDVCGLGFVDGLEGANCRHRRDIWVEGVSERTYTDEQLIHIDDGLGCDYDGAHYTAYEATQMQRRLERTIRKQKRLRDAYKAAGLKEDAQTANIKLRRLNAKYKEFSKAANLPEQRERMRVLVDKNGSDVLREASKSSTISMSIDKPINARDSSVGKPVAIGVFDARLSKRQEALLESLNGYNSRVTVGKRDVSMKDLSALTAKTGDEFAMFTKGGERLIVRGNSVRVQIDTEEAARLATAGYRWSGHTHPGADELTKMASDGDIRVLTAFGQERSVIYDSLGRHEIFRR